MIHAPAIDIYYQIFDSTKIPKLATNVWRMILMTIMMSSVKQLNNLLKPPVSVQNFRDDDDALKKHVTNYKTAITN
jgi:hypothetical protein